MAAAAAAASAAAAAAVAPAAPAVAAAVASAAPAVAAAVALAESAAAAAAASGHFLPDFQKRCQGLVIIKWCLCQLSLLLSLSLSVLSHILFAAMRPIFPHVIRLDTSLSLSFPVSFWSGTPTHTHTLIDTHALPLIHGISLTRPLVARNLHYALEYTHAHAHAHAHAHTLSLILAYLTNVNLRPLAVIQKVSTVIVVHCR